MVLLITSLCSVSDSFVNFCPSEPPVEFTKPLEDQTVEEEATAKLQCEVSRETAEVRWLKEGQEIRMTKKYETVIDGLKRALVIHDCSPEDAKMYTCDAKEFKTTCYLDVTRKHTASSGGCSPHSSSTITIVSHRKLNVIQLLVSSAPHVEFTKPLQDVEVKEKESAKFECEISRESAKVRPLKTSEVS